MSRLPEEDPSGKAAETERLLVYGGAYGNLQATQALYAEADAMGFAPAEIVCTGDLAAYCADPQPVIDLVRARSTEVVMGNCEESLALDSDDCGCGFGEGTQCSLLSREWYAYCRDAVCAESKGWMGTLPRSIRRIVSGRSLLLVHGSLSSANEFVFPSTDPGSKISQLDRSGCDGIVAGHSGLPFVEICGGRLWLNSGALGMPANDGTPRCWYATIEPAAGGLDVRIRSLSYPQHEAARSMREGGLPDGYAACLETGLWPSLDVLPPAERERTGSPLEEIAVAWPAQAAGKPAPGERVAAGACA